MRPRSLFGSPFYRGVGVLEATYLPPPDTATIAKKPEPPKPTTWTIYKVAAKAVRLGTVEAPDEAAAIEKGPPHSRCPPTD
jgi:hypothetical protein